MDEICNVFFLLTGFLKRWSLGPLDTDKTTCSLEVPDAGGTPWFLEPLAAMGPLRLWDS